MNAILTETVTLLETLSSSAAELAAALPSLDLSPAELTTMAEEVERISGLLTAAENRLGFAGTVEYQFERPFCRGLVSRHLA
jgi:hypothetical protein